jgi:hypothetical protein
VRMRRSDRRSLVANGCLPEWVEILVCMACVGLKGAKPQTGHQIGGTARLSTVVSMVRGALAPLAERRPCARSRCLRAGGASDQQALDARSRNTDT